MRIIGWLIVGIIWLCVIAHLKTFYGSGAACLGIALMLAGLFVYDLIRNGKIS